MDDILSWGSSLPDLYERISVIASRRSDLNITLSKKKFVIGNEITFAGLLLTEKGVKRDPARILALSDFPVLKDVILPTCRFILWYRLPRRMCFSGSRSIRLSLKR